MERLKQGSEFRVVLPESMKVLGTLQDKVYFILWNSNFPGAVLMSMEPKSASCLNNSIARFVHLVSCQTMKLIPLHGDFERMAVLMRHLNPFLNEIVHEKIIHDQTLLKECEKLDVDVNQIRECIEMWSPKASIILSVWQIGLLITRIRASALEICRLLCRSLRASPSSSTLDGVQICTDLMELRNWQPSRITTLIEQALKDHRDNSVSSDKDLLELVESLGLISCQQLLKERIYIEKEKLEAEGNQNKGEAEELIDRAADLISLIGDYMLKSGYLDSGYGFSIPMYFRCPLSLELMSDPVIVTSGQTFERSCIQKWVDHGLNICPKTGEPLLHTDIITNHTIKAMILSWLKENNHEILSKSEGSNHGSNSVPRSSTDEPIGVDKEEESIVGQSSEIKKASSSEQLYAHSRTHSGSSTISGYEYPPRMVETVEIKSECFSPQHNRGSSTEISESQNSNYLRTDSFRSSDMGSDETASFSYVEKMVKDLTSQSVEAQASAASEFRQLAKNNMENRVIIRKCGAIGPLIALMRSRSKTTQEHAVTALLNLSINEENKAKIAETGAIESLIHVLKSGNDTAKENSAAALFSLASLEDHKLKIGRTGAVKALVNLLVTGSVRGKKDAVAALFSLSICHENKARIVQAGAVKCLVELLDPGSGLADKAIALLTNLGSVSEGRAAIVRENGVPMIIEILECGSRRGKENAASTLFHLCLHSDKFCTMVLEEGAVPPLVALSQTGTPRAREKAQQLLSHFRSRRETATSGKRKIIKGHVN
ncbi:hypothetical protein V2J09_022145 [Rumex salicifolius]